MPAKKESENPLTLNQLYKFFKDVLEPRFQFLDQEIQTVKLDQKHIRDNLKLFRAISFESLLDLYKQSEKLNKEQGYAKQEEKN